MIDKTLFYYILMNVTTCFVQCLFSFSLLTPKWKRIPTFLLFFIPFTLGALSQKIFTEVSPSLLVIAAMSIFVFESLFLFKDKLKYKIFVLAMNLLINIAFLGMILPIMYELTGMDTNSMSPMYIIINCFIFLIDFIVALAIKNRKQTVDIDGKSVAVFSSITLTQFITYFILMVILNSETMYESGKHFSIVGSSQIEMVNLVYALLGVFVVADILVFYLLKKAYHARKTEEELALAEYKNEINLDYYKNVEHNQLEIRKIYHDMNNIIDVCKNLSENETAQENAESILNDIENKLNESKIIKYCNNTLANAVLSSKINLCKTKNITVTAEINLPEHINITESDLCRSLVNLFDNAIEAAEKCENTFVKFSSGIDNDTLFIVTENPIPPVSDKKKDGKNHGFGLKILSDVAKKYNGELTSTDNNGSVRKMLILKLN